MKCITIWNNKVIDADLIEIKFIKDNNLITKVFRSGYRYPNQYWKVKSIKIVSSVSTTEYDSSINDIIFSVNYENNYYYIE